MRLYSYSNDVSIAATGPSGPINPTAKQFALRFVNHDQIHPIQKIGILYKKTDPSQGGYISINSGNAVDNDASSLVGTKVSTLFFSWTDLNQVNGQSHIRELILGPSDTSVYNSAQIYIAKTDLTYDSGLQTWLIDTGGLQSPPIPYYLSTTPTELTMDVIELTYNWYQIAPGNYNTTNWALTFNQTNVDAWSIPMTISLIYKDNNGARRMTNGPVGSTRNANDVFNQFKTLAGSSAFSEGLIPAVAPHARIINTTHQSNTAALNTYNDSYISQFWQKWSGSPVTFYPQATGPGSSWISATVQTAGDVTGLTDSSVATVQAFGNSPATFPIYARDVYQKAVDLYGAAGVWIKGDSTERSVKAVLAAALTRGVATGQGDFLGTHSYIAGVSAANTIWNGYSDKGSGFYNNITPNIYGKVIHENVLQGQIDSFTLPYAYAISYDDTFNYSSTITSAQVFPTTDTQALRAEINIYTNDNF